MLQNTARVSRRAGQQTRPTNSSTHHHKTSVHGYLLSLRPSCKPCLCLPVFRACFLPPPPLAFPTDTSNPSQPCIPDVFYVGSRSHGTAIYSRCTAYLAPGSPSAAYRNTQIPLHPRHHAGKAIPSPNPHPTLSYHYTRHTRLPYAHVSAFDSSYISASVALGIRCSQREARLDASLYSE